MSYEIIYYMIYYDTTQIENDCKSPKTEDKKELPTISSADILSLWQDSSLSSYLHSWRSGRGEVKVQMVRATPATFSEELLRRRPQHFG